MRRALLKLLVGLPLLYAAGGASAAGGDWPQRPVRIVAPFAPGGSADTLGRLIARDLSERLGQPFIVDNRPGAGGLIGTTQVARAPADGYTLGISGIASHVIAVATNAGANGFDALRDFTHIAYLGGPPVGFVVGPGTSARSMPEALALARGSRTLSFATPGAGTHGALIGEMFRQATGANLESIPYRGGGNGMSDLLGGSVDAAFIALTSAAEPLRDRRIFGIAVSTAERLPGFPAIPTFAELGYPNLTATTWFGLAGPANLPAPVVERLNAEVRRILAKPDIRARLEADGLVSPAMTAPEFTRFVAEEIARWTPIARASAAQAR
ncbi:Bug family tripartite tricarboxylate transporter substrate binding protein [Muricoccus vinaceus]|uniref:Bug family tripartite tricarboxylate transporter substrate binding protein n=1 Tax=Muricoccus vinaceus TaxID=424704 RepID=A0ABV6IQP5_9PROT